MQSSGMVMLFTFVEIYRSEISANIYGWAHLGGHFDGEGNLFEVLMGIGDGRSASNVGAEVVELYSVG